MECGRNDRVEPQSDVSLHVHYIVLDSSPRLLLRHSELIIAPLLTADHCLHRGDRPFTGETTERQS